MYRKSLIIGVEIDEMANRVTGLATSSLCALQDLFVLTMPAAPVPIKDTIVDSTTFKTVPPDPRNLRPVANISGVIDDYKLLAFIAFKDGFAGGRGFRDYGRRGDDNRAIAAIRIVSFVRCGRRR